MAANPNETGTGSENRLGAALDAAARNRGQEATPTNRGLEPKPKRKRGRPAKRTQAAPSAPAPAAAPVIAPKPAPVTAMQVEIARARAAGKERLAAPNLEALSPTMVKRKLEADHYCRGPNAETQYPADRWHDFWDESKNQEMRVGMGYIPVIDTKGNPVRDGLDQLFVIDDRLHQRGLEAAAAESRRLLNDGSPEVGESKSAKWSDGAVDEEISVTTGSAEDIERAAAAMSDDDG